MAQARAEAGTAAGTHPKHAPVVLTALILAASVANINLAVANVALPSIGAAFDASQTQLNLVAVGYSLGLASSVLYLGAIGDRYGRKQMLLGGVALSIPACLLAAYAPSVEVLIVARLLGGLSAGMAYPTTLALITALWSGRARTRSIALWSGLGAAVSSLGPLLAGSLLLIFWWGSVFLITVVLAVVTLVLAWKAVPGHVNEAGGAVDNLGGVASIVAIGGLVLAVNFAPTPGELTRALVLAGVALVAGVAFVWRQRRAGNPLFDLTIARRPTFWVAALAGMIVFGSLMGALFVGQQFLQDVLDYSTFTAALAVVPASVLMVVVAPRSARLLERVGSRLTLLSGYFFCLLGFVTMLLLWGESTPYWKIGLAYVFIGIGVGLAGTPASHSLTSSVPVRRVGMASGTADLQRDLGGAVIQSIFGALLTAAYSASIGRQIADAPDGQEVTSQVETALQKSFASAEQVAARYPQYASAITNAAKEALLDGGRLTHLAGIIFVLLGSAVVFFFFPRKGRERELMDSYVDEDGDAEE